MTPNRLGWILIHSHVVYPEGNYATPQEELAVEFNPGMLWHWKRAKPMKEGGPYTLLFAWNGEIFGESIGHVTQKVEDKKYNFAFRLYDYEGRKSVKLDDLPVTRNYRDLIKLSPEILATYRKLVCT